MEYDSDIFSHKKSPMCMAEWAGSLPWCSNQTFPLVNLCWILIKRDVYWETIPKVGKHRSEQGAKTGYRVEFVKIEVMINSCRKWYGEFEKTSCRLQWYRYDSQCWKRDVSNMSYGWNRQPDDVSWSTRIPSSTVPARIKLTRNYRTWQIM